MSDVTRLLDAADLLPLVYDELRKLAAARLAAEKPGQTLQPTALAHEAYLRLVGPDGGPEWAGRGADLIGGNGADDILVAGFTSFDANLAALGLLAAEWGSIRTFAERVANLSGSGGTGVNGSALLTESGAGQSVFDDAAVDRLTGDAGNDWFVFNSVGGPFVDQAADMSAFEGMFDIDLLP